jgi:polyhydroxybutyrate depolymerase
VCIILGLLSAAACGADTGGRALPEAHAVEVAGGPQRQAAELDLAAAEGEPGSIPPTSPVPEAEPHPDGTPSTGCTLGVGLEAGVHLRPWLGVERQVIVRPPAIDVVAPVPVVLNLHGSAASAATHEAFIHFSQPAAARGFLVLTPEGMPPDEAEHQVWEFFPGVHPDDVGYLASLVDWVGEAHCVDLDRVFAAGYSNGSTMTNVLACHTSGRFRAVAGVGAHRFPIICPSGPVSVLGIHGTADPFVPYLGGHLIRRPDIWMPPVEETFDLWAASAGCDPAPRFEVVAPDVTRRLWGKCDSGAQVALYAVIGGGHEWPWVDDPMYPGKLDATTTILDFFEAH